MATINQITVNSTTYDLAVSAANVSGTVANATTATKLGTANKGSATQPIYLSAGAPAACTYSLAKSVPANAKFTDTTYSNFVKSGSGAKAGLVPAPSTTAGTTKYLREDGTWQVPPDTNTTYSAATTSANGLMTSAMVTKLNGIATGATKNSVTTSLASTSTTNALAASAGKSLQDQITALNSDLACVNLSLTKNSSVTGTFYGDAYYNKITKLLIVRFSLTNTSVSIGTILFTIPEEYRPISEGSGICFMTNSTLQGIAGYCTVNTSGQVVQTMASNIIHLSGLLVYRVG